LIYDKTSKKTMPAKIGKAWSIKSLKWFGKSIDNPLLGYDQGRLRVRKSFFSRAGVNESQDLGAKVRLFRDTVI